MAAPGYVKAAYDFSGAHADELSFKTGDVIKVTRRIDADWYEGTHTSGSGGGGGPGIFPAKFVQPTAAPVPSPAAGASLGDAVATHNFEAQQADELSFSKGDVIQLTKKINDEWYEGKLRRKVGIFPSNFVQLKSSKSTKAAPPPRRTPSAKGPAAPSSKITGPHAIATHEFAGQMDDELSFSKQDTIMLTRRIDDDWLEGKLRGKTGIFPANFVRVVVPVGSTPAKKPGAGRPPPPKATSFKAATKAPPPSRKPSTARPGKPPPAVQKQKPPPSEPYAKGAFEYTAKQGDELGFGKGDIVILTRRVDDEWYSGYLATDPAKRQGIFPRSFVEVCRDVPAPAAPGKAAAAATPTSATKTRAPPPGKLAPSRGSTPGRPPPSRASHSSPTPTLPKPKARAATVSAPQPTAVTPTPRTKPTPTAAPKPKPQAKARPSKGPVPQPRAKPRAKPKPANALPPPLPSTRAFSVSSESRKKYKQQQAADKEAAEAKPTALEQVEAEIAALEAELDEQVEKQLGLQTLLEVVPESRAAKRKETEANLDACQDRIVEIETQLDRLDAKKAQLGGGGSGGDLNSRINQLQGEIDDERRQVEADPHNTEIQRGLTDKELTLSGLKAKRGDAAPAAPAPAMSADEQAAKREKRRAKRVNVVGEILQTETEYIRDLQLCQEGYLLSPEGFRGGSVPDGLDEQGLFGNFEDVLAAAEAFCGDLEAECSKVAGAQCIGTVFCTHAERFLEVYVKYCCTFDDASALITVYNADAAKKAFFDGCQKLVNANTNCWDIGSFLIKPVQRILKYPLLLGDLFSNTEGDHPDHKAILTAVNKMGDVAVAINEGKRRKELVDKYKDEQANSRVVKFDRLNWHSTRKKASRFGQRFVNTVARKQTGNDNFAAAEKRFTDLELAARKLRKRATENLAATKEMFEFNAGVVKALKDVYTDPEEGFPEHVQAVADSYEQMRPILDAFAAGMAARVTEPLTRLLGMFEAPQFLINKCADKLLDYDRSKRKATKDMPAKMKKEQELIKNTFEALNSQLIEELPKFTGAGETVMSRCMGSVLHLQRELSAAVAALLMPLVEQDPSGPGLGRIHEESAHCLRSAIEELLEMALVPRSIAREFSIANPPAPIKPSQQRRAATSTSSSGSGSGGTVGGGGAGTKSMRTSVSGSALSKSPRTPGGTGAAARRRAKRQTIKKQRPRAIVLYDFEATNEAEVDVTEGTEVEVVTKHDLSNNPEWWAVKRPDGQQGFVPSNYLEMAAADDRKAVGNARALYDFEASTELEVDISAGDEIAVLARQDPEGNAEWWLVKTRAGRSGYVPGAYLEEA